MTEASSTDSDLADAQGLGTLSAGADLELDVLAFVEAAVALAFDVGVVDEDVFATGYGDESVALFAVEELYGAGRHVSVSLSLDKNRITSTRYGKAYGNLWITGHPTGQCQVGSGLALTALSDEVRQGEVRSGERDGAVRGEVEEVARLAVTDWPVSSEMVTSPSRMIFISWYV